MNGNKIAPMRFLDPDYEGFDGCYIGVKNAPEITHDLRALLDYAKREGKKVADFSDEEIKRFEL